MGGPGAADAPSTEQVDDVLEILQKPELDVEKQKKEIRDVLGLKPGQALPEEITDGLGLGLGQAEPGRGTLGGNGGLLNFLLAP
jgi:hypothetical protein